jgi:GNAT superfamily N-acetyltransferase
VRAIVWASPYLAAHAAYLRHLGTAPAAEAIDAQGLYAVRTGVRSNAENGVLGNPDARLRRDRVQRLIGWFHEWGAPASWLCPEGHGRAEAASLLEEIGCLPERSGWEMRARLGALDLDCVDRPAGTRIELVAFERELDGWLHVAGTCEWFETEPGRRAWRDLLLGLGLAGRAPLRLYLAYHGDAAVGMASAFYGEDVVLLNAVGVLPEARRRGIGRALALRRLDDARDRGCELAVLAPSPDGAKLYESLGFETHAQPPDRWFYLPARAGASPRGAA